MRRGHWGGRLYGSLSRSLLPFSFSFSFSFPFPFPLLFPNPVPVSVPISVPIPATLLLGHVLLWFEFEGRGLSSALSLLLHLTEKHLLLQPLHKQNRGRTGRETHPLQLSIRVRVTLGQEPLSDLLQLLLFSLPVPLVHLDLLLSIPESLLESAAPAEGGREGGSVRKGPQLAVTKLRPDEHL